MNERIIRLSKDSLDIVNKFSLFPMVLYNSYKIFFSNEKFDNILSYKQFDDVKNQMGFDLDKIKNCNREFYLEDKQNKYKWYEIVYELVEYQGENCILAYFIDISSKKKNEKKIEKLSKLRALMLEVTQAIAQQEDLEEIFELILKNSLKAMDKATLGSILIRKEDELIVASSIGFDKAIDDFRILIKDSFLYKVTDGRFDRIINLNDLTNFDCFIPIQTSLGKEIFIKSTLSAPIYINDKLFGMINIDSVNKNAFDEVDIKAMEFLKPNIEIALTNHFLYQEKVLLARHDPLTQISNRGYFEEQFDVILQTAARYKDTFCFAVFDVDGLKKINDSEGHLVGDEVIKQVAKVLEANKRKSDLVARIGGDEFVGVYQHSDSDLLSKRLDLIINSMQNNPIDSKNGQVIPSFTFGIAIFPEDGETLEQLFKVADNRMYAKKNRKYNR